MGLAGKAIHREYVEGEPAEWIEFRQLGSWDLKRAGDELSHQGREIMREMGAGWYAQMPDRPNRAPDPQRDRLKDYDLWTLLEFSIVNWSYDAPVTLDSIRLLDEPTAEWAGRTVLRLSGINADPLGMTTVSSAATPSRNSHDLISISATNQGA